MQKDSVKKRKRSECLDCYEQLHLKNPYKNKAPNFLELSLIYPSLQKYVVADEGGRCKVSWNSPDAGKVVTAVLLEQDFHLSIDFPDNHLSPPLPNRINYLCWLSDLLDQDTSASSQIVCDIGVGPGCIYPLLGNRLFSWRFVGSDIDQDSVDSAVRNVAANCPCESDISIVHVPDSEAAQNLVCGWLNTLYVRDEDTNDSDTGEKIVCGLLNVLTPQGSSDTASPTYHRGPLANTLFALGGQFRARLIQCELSAHDQPAFLFLDRRGALSLVRTCTTNFPQIHGNVYNSTCSGSAAEMRTAGGEVAFVTALIADSLLLRNS